MTKITPADRTDDLPNAALDVLHRRLVTLVADLDLAIDDATDATQVRVLTEQIAAANVRVTAVGRVLFARQSKDVTAAAGEVAKSIPEVERALADLARLETFVSTMTGMLKLVDGAVATARLAS